VNGKYPGIFLIVRISVWLNFPYILRLTHYVNTLVVEYWQILSYMPQLPFCIRIKTRTHVPRKTREIYAYFDDILSA